MASKSDRKVACLGAGYFAAFHYDAWRRIDAVHLVGACDTDLEKAEATGAPAYSDLHRMLRETQPDILDIITPPPSHMAAIRAALEAGVGTIICQKDSGPETPPGRRHPIPTIARGSRVAD